MAEKSLTQSDKTKKDSFEKNAKQNFDFRHFSALGVPEKPLCKTIEKPINYSAFESRDDGLSNYV